MEKPFVHLHNHSDYSLLDGASKIEAMVRLTAEKGMPAIALTDHGNLFGAIEFYKTATRGVEIETGGQTRLVKIKPILGMEAYLTGGSMESRQAKGPGEYNHLTLLSENDEGFRNLTVLSSLGYTRGFYYKPRIDMEALGKYRSGLIALSGCVRGPVADLIFRGKPDKAREAASGLLDLFGPDNFFIEIMDHGLDIERQVLPELIKIARELGIPLVATNDCHYLNREDFEAQDALVCIGRNQQLDDPKRQRIETRELYLKSPEEMYATFPDHPEAVARTLEIAERCNVQFEFGKNHLPAFPLPDGYTEVQLLDELARKGARDRYGPERKEIEDRLRYELDIIENAGYAGYFLIVSDFVDYARQHDIPVGPGRGSAAGSIVSYCLGITDIDPLEYDLLFERFLNPERVEMPDIDIDFSDRGREEVYRYVKQKYGEGNVTQVITFGTMAARAVVKDVGRVLGLPYGEVENFAKLIPEDHGITLEEALRKRPELTEKAASNSTFGKLMRISKVLEGVHRHASTHAAAVVIAPGELTNYVPLFRSPRTEDITTQYDMKCVESMGLLKMDFLRSENGGYDWRQIKTGTTALLTDA
ncbi:MAG: DNA polymerase III subunit alpha, partial [Gemmatimonadota bacterium]|nr:DNA polymerase III subunit alpha [Gemmatimonadota bacterium]